MFKTKFTGDKPFFVLSICAALAATFFIFIPGNIFFPNQLDFSDFQFKEILTFLIFLSVISAGLIFLVLRCLPAKIFEALYSMIFAFTALIWIQAYFFVWDYGRLDGSMIPWDRYNKNAALEIVVWATILIVCFINKNKLHKLGGYLSLFLFISQSIELANNIYRAPQETFKTHYFDELSKFEFGKDKNIILLVVDTFQSDVFQEIIDTAPEYRDFFDGFNYFPNSLAGFPVTYPSIPFMLTGQQYDNSKPFQSFLEKSFLNEKSSISRVLFAHNYRVDYYPLVSKLVLVDSLVAGNVKEKAVNLLRTNLSMTVVANVGLLEISVFRISPHIVKKAVFGRMAFMPPAKHKIKDLDFKAMATKQSKLGQDQNVFKYFHLLGAHPPFILNEKLEYEESPSDRNGYKRQSKAALRIVESFLSDLKRIGAFNNAMIFIVADHGFYTHSMGIRDGQGESPIAEKVRAAALPLILVKRPGELGPLKINKAPVSIGDIGPTIFKSLSISDVQGFSFFDAIPAKRERRFLYFSNGIDGNYLSPFDEFIVSGDSKDGSSWTATNKRYSKDGVSNISSDISQTQSSQ